MTRQQIEFLSTRLNDRSKRIRLNMQQEAARRLHQFVDSDEERLEIRARNLEKQRTP